MTTACVRWLANHDADWSVLEFHQQEAGSSLDGLPPELPISRSCRRDGGSIAGGEFDGQAPANGN